MKREGGGTFSSGGADSLTAAITTREETVPSGLMTARMDLGLNLLRDPSRSSIQSPSITLGTGLIPRLKTLSSSDRSRPTIPAMGLNYGVTGAGWKIP